MMMRAVRLAVVIRVVSCAPGGDSYSACRSCERSTPSITTICGKSSPLNLRPVQKVAQRFSSVGNCLLAGVNAVGSFTDNDQGASVDSWQLVVRRCGQSAAACPER